MPALHQDKAHQPEVRVPAMTQTARVLAAFLAAPNKSLKTGDIQRIPYCASGRQEVSRLRAQGHTIGCQRIKGTKSSLFTYHGYTPLLAALPKETPLEPLGRWVGADSFQIWCPAEEVTT